MTLKIAVERLTKSSFKQGTNNYQGVFRLKQLLISVASHCNFTLVPTVFFAFRCYHHFQPVRVSDPPLLIYQIPDCPKILYPPTDLMWEWIKSFHTAGHERSLGHRCPDSAGSVLMHQGPH